MTTPKASLRSSGVLCTPIPRLNHVRNPSFRIRQAVRDNNVSLLSRLHDKYDLRNTDKNRLTSLSWAAIEGNLEVFEWLLLDWGHDDQELSRDADNNTILHLLASIPTPPASQSHYSLLPPVPPTRSKEESQSIAIRMLELYHTLFPFLIDWSNSGGKTPLHVAAQAGNSDFIGVLIELGADVDLTDLQGNSPLHYASAWGHLETIQVLVESGCSSALRNAEGFTAMDYAFSDRIAVLMQNAAKEVQDGRRNRPPDLSDRIRRGDTDKRHRTRSGSLSTTNSGARSTAGSSAQGRSSLSYRTDAISPNGQLLGRDRYFDQYVDPSRNIPSRSSSHIGPKQPTPGGSPGPPIPPSKSPSLPPLPPKSTQSFTLGPSATQRSPELQMQQINPGTAVTMRRANSSQMDTDDREATITMRRAGSDFDGPGGRR